MLAFAWKSLVDKLSRLDTAEAVKMYNMHEAKTHLSKIVREVEAGDTVLIGRGGEPLVVLSPYRKETKRRQPGRMKGKVDILEGFDEIDDEIARLFIGSDE